MRFTVGGNGWATQGRCYDPGVVINDGKTIATADRTNGPPIDALALDQVTYDYMISWGCVGMGYPPWLVRGGPGVNTFTTATRYFALDSSLIGGPDVLK